MATETLYTTGAYATTNPTWHEEDAPWKAKQIASILAANGVAPGRVVEVGCGAGGVLHHLLDRCPGATGVGYDIAPDAIARARRREAGRLAFRCEDFLATAESDFDLLLCIDVFEHVEDYLGFLRALRGRAERYVFHIPLDMHVNWLLRDQHPVVRRRVGHLHYFSKATALATLQDAGYEVVDWRYTRGAEELMALHPHWGPKARIGNLGRRIIRSLGGDDLAAKVLGGHSLLALAR